MTFSGKKQLMIILKVSLTHSFFLSLSLSLSLTLSLSHLGKYFQDPYDLHG